MSTRRKPRKGAILRIELGPDHWTFGRVLDRPFIAVYDSPNMPDRDLKSVLRRPILFVVGIFDNDVRGMPVVGSCGSEEPDIAIPDQFLQDIGNPARCRKIDASENMQEVEPHDCVGLERVVIWSLPEIVERVEDHYAEPTNRQVEMNKVMLPPFPG